MIKKALSFMLLVVISISVQAQLNVQFIQRFKEFIAARDCNGANNLVQNTNLANGERYFLFGSVSKYCENNQQKAVNYFSYSARWGQKEAVDELLSDGMLVPSPDLLVQEQQAQARRDAALANAFKPVQIDTHLFDNVGKNNPPPSSTVHTECHRIGANLVCDSR